MSSNPRAAEIFEDAGGDVAVGELEAATAKYQECVSLDPEFFDAWHALGMVLMKTGRHAEAVEAGLRAVALRPNDQLAWSSLSLFHVRNGNIKEAESAGVKARIISWGGNVEKMQLDPQPPPPGKAP